MYVLRFCRLENTRNAVVFAQCNFFLLFSQGFYDWAAAGGVGSSFNRPNDTLMSLATDVNQVKPVPTGRFTVGKEIKVFTETSLSWQK